MPNTDVKTICDVPAQKERSGYNKKKKKTQKQKSPSSINTACDVYNLSAWYA